MAMLSKLKEAAIAAGYQWSDITDALSGELAKAVVGNDSELRAALAIAFPNIAYGPAVDADITSISSQFNTLGPKLIQLPAPKVKVVPGAGYPQTTFDGQPLSSQGLFIKLAGLPSIAFDPAYNGYIQMERRRPYKATRRDRAWVASEQGSHISNDGQSIPNRQSRFGLAGLSAASEIGPIELATYRKLAYPKINGEVQLAMPVWILTGEKAWTLNSPAQAARRVPGYSVGKLKQYLRFRVVLINPVDNSKVVGPVSEVVCIRPEPFPFVVLPDKSVTYRPSTILAVRVINGGS